MVDSFITRELECDSLDYELITNAINRIPTDLVGMTCEIGVRRGGGSKYIMSALGSLPFKRKVHVGIDPYGNIEYADREDVIRRLDYTNQMRDESMGPMYRHAQKTGVNFVLMNFTDTQFFQRFADGVPVYDQEEGMLSKYIFVHFDGPHQFDPIKAEFDWFNERMDIGATIVFDDLAHYDHNLLEQHIFKSGWELLEKTQRKASYQRSVS